MSAQDAENTSPGGIGRLIRAFYHQLLHGCTDPQCDKEACLQRRIRASRDKPLRPPSVLTAQSMALTLASQPDAEQLLCSQLRGLDILSSDPAPSKIDTNSLSQAVFSTKTMRDLFEASFISEAFDQKVNSELMRVGDPASALTAQSQRLWPLPHPLATAKSWMRYVEHPEEAKDPKSLLRRARRVLKPYGYDTPSLRHEATTIRAICLLRMQRTVQLADYHFDLIKSPTQFFMSANLGILPLRHSLAQTLGVTAHPSDVGMHSVVRRYLAIVSSRLAPFTMACNEFARIQKRQVLLPLRVQWMSLDDIGIDYGGVAQEFFQEIVTEASQAPLHLFQESEEDSGFMWINPGACDDDRLVAYECFGAMMGLAIHNGFTLPVSFPLIFYKVQQEWQESLNPEAIREGWPRKYQALKSLLTQSIDGAGVPDAFEVELPAMPAPLNEGNFFPDAENQRWSIGLDRADCQQFFKDKVWALKNIAPYVRRYGESFDAGEVTDTNKIAYAAEFLTWLLQSSVIIPHAAIRRGLSRIISNHLIENMSAESLRLVVEGDANITAQKLEALVAFNFWDEERDYQVGDFWRVLQGWPAESLQKLLRFVTGSDRLPIGCDKTRNPAFTVRHSNEGSTALPKAMTCSKALLLPAYTEFSVMREKLEFAVENTTTFGLS